MIPISEYIHATLRKSLVGQIIASQAILQPKGTARQKNRGTRIFASVYIACLRNGVTQRSAPMYWCHLVCHCSICHLASTPLTKWQVMNAFSAPYRCQNTESWSQCLMTWCISSIRHLLSSPLEPWLNAFASCKIIEYRKFSNKGTSPNKGIPLFSLTPSGSIFTFLPMSRLIIVLFSSRKKPLEGGNVLYNLDAPPMGLS